MSDWHDANDMFWVSSGKKEKEPTPVEVTEVEEGHIKLDANPPLAGKDLIFDIELVQIS